MNKKNFGIGQYGFGPGIGNHGRGNVRGYTIGGGLPHRGANLNGADLRGADFFGEDLEAADLRGADLRGANLEGAHLASARLEGAKFRGADLDGANLSHARLAGADLRGANFGDAYLVGADFTDARVSEPHHVAAIQAAARDMILSIRVGDDEEDPLAGPRYEPALYDWHPDPSAAAQNTFDDTLGGGAVLRAEKEKMLAAFAKARGRTGNPGQGTRRGPRGYKY